MAILTHELAEKLQRSLATIQRWAKAGLIPSRRRGPLSPIILFDFEEVEAAMQKIGLKRGKVLNIPKHGPKRLLNLTKDARMAYLNSSHIRRTHSTACASATPADITKLLTETTVCHYCGVKLDATDKLKRPTLDHVLALSKGGGHTVENLVVACKQCNCKKGDRPNFIHTCKPAK